MIAVTRFRLRAGVEESAFREADARYQMEFAYRQPGLLRRTTASSAEGEWIAIDLWRTPGDADDCLRRAGGDPVARAHAEMLDPASVSVARYRDLDA